MATVKKVFVFISCVLSGLGVLISLASIVTEHWVKSDQITANYTQTYQSVSYGLFDGTLRMKWPYTYSAPVTMTCLAKENVCALLCDSSKEKREQLLQDLFDQKPGLNESCQLIYNRANNRYHGASVPIELRAGSSDSKFINYGVWVSTILFLVLSMVFGAISAALSFYNTVSNPIEVYLSLYGVYLYNAVALLSLLMSMLLWGVMFNITLFHDVGIFLTLYGQMSSDKQATLGYSYWLNIGPMLLYIGSIFVLFLRQYFISKDPGRKIVERDDDGDPVIYLY